MTVFALLRVTPITEDDITPDVAAAIEALEAYDVTYETTPMATTLEADDVHELFAACAAAHEAVDRGHVQTLVQVDDKREVKLTASDKVDAVEGELGREATSERRGE
ncbi:thiamine-binding protein [Natronosalvus vescus]|uniref:thiamine-binding protein n=1 Tax=Natronosalvus vescus TaxID=2953881 RepID=UPI0020910459|nr:thiamine-binding protein [Natronosalvus vescus]